jgi:murein DD-endopeptidase MepM/ murein hydrolase activator NlpD
MKRILGLLILSLLIGGGGALGYLHYQFQVFDQNPPLIQFPQPLKGVGASPRTLKVSISDQEAGLDEVIVRVGRQEIFKKGYIERRKESDILEIPVDAKSLGLKEGSFEVQVKVFDKSFFNNGSEQAHTILVDYIRPRVEGLTVQHNGFGGGALLTFYRILSDDVARSGVKVGDTFTRGHRAELLDPAFQGHPDVYFALFPIPAEFDSDNEKAAVYAEDEAGNFASVPFYQKIKPRKQREDKMKMPKDFFIRKVNDLTPKYRTAIGESPLQRDAADMTNEELAAGFRDINENYRKYLDDKIRALANDSMEQRFWTGHFERPLAAAPTATYAEKRLYSVEAVSAGTSIHMGVDLAQSANAELRASNGGIVVFADDFGIYGETVILDHGFGLMTLYGHLSSIAVQVGDKVEKGTKLGRTGETGLAGGDHLHFEFRLAGTPVTPFEWLDPGWIKSHIEGQIEFAKGQLGGGAP